MPTLRRGVRFLRTVSTKRASFNAATAAGKEPSRLGPRLSLGWSEEARMRLILFIIVILLLVGALPTWPYSAGWGYYPSGGLGLVVIVLLVLLLVGYI
jgi:Protein of unknown function (DUF3309)